jgi:hypothetical protein
MALGLLQCQSLDIRILPGDASPSNDAGTKIHPEAGAEAAPSTDAGGGADAGRDATSGDAAKGDAGKPPGEGGFDCDGSTATICDDFNRTVTIPAGDRRWASSPCNVDGGSIGVDGTLNIKMPAVSQGVCSLESYNSPLLGHPIASVGSFQVDFDVNFDTDTSSPTIVLVNVDLSTETDEELIQLLVDGLGQGQLYVLYRRDGYTPHQFGSLYEPTVWAPPRSDCHITLKVDTTIPTGTATSTCLGVTNPLMPSGATIPSGLAGPVILSLGYAVNVPSTTPAWTLAIDNLVFQTSP